MLIAAYGLELPWTRRLRRSAPKQTIS